MKVSLTEEETAASAAAFTLANPMHAANPLVTLSLRPHEHSLFCERKERVCTSSGKLQEHETVQVSFLEDAKARTQLSSLRWHRSVARDLPPGAEEPDAAFVASLEFAEIAGTEGRASYELTAGDVGRFLKVTGAMAAAPKPVAAPAGEAGAEAEAGTEAEAQDDKGQAMVKAKGFESGAVLGPVAPGPPRLLQIKIAGQAVVGQSLQAELDYVGGAQGASEFWWLRIRDGDRENLSEPVALTAEQVARFDPADRAAVASDPRVYLLKDADRGCIFKLKCRPVRADGYRGEVFTSKPSATVA